MKCEICDVCKTNKGKPLNIVGLSRHLYGKHTLTKEEQKNYFDRHLKKTADGICKNCGKETQFISISRRYKKSCNRSCHFQWVNKNFEKNKSFFETVEYREKMSLAIKERNKKHPEIVERLGRLTSIRNKKQWQNANFREKTRKNMQIACKNKKCYSDPAWKLAISKRVSKQMKKRWQNAKYYEKMSQMSKNLWKDEKWAREQLAKIAFGNQQVSPNKAEQKLKCVLDKTFAQETFKFVGDGQLVINGLCPDFVFENKLIELYGDYWHRNETEEDIEKRKKHFANEGYDCIVVWENELKDEEALKEKLVSFMKGNAT